MGNKRVERRAVGSRNSVRIVLDRWIHPDDTATRYLLQVDAVLVLAPFEIPIAQRRLGSTVGGDRRPRKVTAWAADDDGILWAEDIAGRREPEFNLALA